MGEILKIHQLSENMSSDIDRCYFVHIYECWCTACLEYGHLFIQSLIIARDLKNSCMTPLIK